MDTLRRASIALTALTALAGGCAGTSHGSVVPDGGSVDAGNPARDLDGARAVPRRDAATKADASSHADGGKATGLRVVMGAGGSPGHIVNAAGQIVQLHGIDRSGTEYACIQGWGIFDGPSDQTSVDAIKSWNADAVRVPLNEDCWLGINGVGSSYGGASYVSAITDYVNLLTKNDLVVILDLHWSAPGTEPATGQLNMADLDHSPTFWSQVAAAFASNGSVIFDLFNEPFITDWGCWVSGGACGIDSASAPFTAAGMATLLKAVRTAGASNVVILGGLGYSSDFSQWVQSVSTITTLAAPLDGISLANVAASWHEYDFGSTNTGCPSQYNGYSTSATCYSGLATATNTQITSVLAAGYPMILGESGISAYKTATPFSASQVTELETWYNSLLTWVEQQGQGYLAWTWNTDGDPYLLLDYTGTPTPGFGQTYQAHIKGL
jgi:hypothetical protein